MKKKVMALVMVAALASAMMVGCGSKTAETEATTTEAAADTDAETTEAAADTEAETTEAASEAE